jgi:putative DNA primase/helicase
MTSADNETVMQPNDIRRFLELLFAIGNGVLHVRALKGKSHRKTALGYFDNVAEAENAIRSIDGQFETIAVGFNPFNPALLARCKNRLDGGASGVSDSDVVARVLLVVDVDSNRPTGVCATDAEIAAVRLVALDVRSALLQAGFPEPLVLFSGNGFHLVYRVDLPADDGGLLKQCLEALSYRFTTAEAQIDLTMANAARVLRVPGTQNCKGDSTPDRPHRRSTIRHFPEQLVVVERSVLEAVAAWTPDAPAKSSSPKVGGVSVDLVKFAAEHQLTIRREKEWRGGRVFELDACPFNPEHSGGSASLIQHASGAVGFKCHHDSCTGNDWKALKAHLGIAGPLRPHPLPGQQVASPRRMYMRTDTGNAERLRDQAGQGLRFVEDAGSYLLWDETRWLQKSEAIAIASTKPVVRSILDEVQFAETEAEAKEILKWAKKSESLTNRAAMLKLFRAEAGMAIAAKQLDAQPSLLNFTNGTLELESGRVRPHARDDWLTKRVPYAFDADAKSPRFDTFIERILPDVAVRDYLQRLCGYALYGAVEDHILAMLIGEGNNGKSTLINALLAAFGADFSKQGASSLLLKQKSPQHPTELADLFGARLIVCSEIENGGELDEARVKQLTGGDMVRARWMHKDYFEFQPSHTILLAANSLPTIHGRDEGIWRRIAVIPFVVYLEPHEVDPRLGAVLRSERAGIMAWAVRGFRAWRERGLGAPDAVREAVELYRYRSDVVAAFLRDRCRLDEGLSAAASELEAAYVAYQRTSGKRNVSWRDAQRVIEKRGVIKKRTSAGFRYEGIGLLDASGRVAGASVQEMQGSYFLSTSSIALRKEIEDPAYPTQQASEPGVPSSPPSAPTARRGIWVDMTVGADATSPLEYEPDPADFPEPEPFEPEPFEPEEA